MTDTEQPVLMLGNIVKDRLSGFTGYLTSRTTWLYGCVRYSITPNTLHEGKHIPTKTFDDGQVEFVEAGIGVPWRDEPKLLGKPIKDRITGLEGICTAYTQTLFNHDDVVLTPQTVKDGKPGDSVGLMREQAEVVVDKPAIEPRRVTPPPGGDQEPIRAERETIRAAA